MGAAYLNGRVYLIGGRDPQIPRLLQCIRIDLGDLQAEHIALHSFSWSVNNDS